MSGVIIKRAHTVGFRREVVTVPLRSLRSSDPSSFALQVMFLIIRSALDFIGQNHDLNFVNKV